MIPIRSKFKAITRAAVIAVALGAGSLMAAPAFAQGAPSFEFNLQIPDGGGQNDGNGFGRRNGNDYNQGNDGRYRCLTNREVRRGIADYGFRRVEVTQEFRRDRVEVVGQYGNWLYSMRVDKCTGEVDRVERLRRDRDRGDGFGFEFNFGN